MWHEGCGRVVVAKASCRPHPTSCGRNSLVPDKSFFFELCYWCGFLISAAFGNPIPEEVMISMAGVRAATMADVGLWCWLLLPACMIGAVIADFGLYAIGRVFGARLLEHAWLAKLA